MDREGAQEGLEEKLPERAPIAVGRGVYGVTRETVRQGIPPWADRDEMCQDDFEMTARDGRKERERTAECSNATAGPDRPGGGP